MRKFYDADDFSSGSYHKPQPPTPQQQTDSLGVDELKKCLWEYVRAAGRMRDKWSDGDEAVKNELWKNLHSLEDKARELLESFPASTHPTSEALKGEAIGFGEFLREHIIDTEPIGKKWVDDDGEDKSTEQLYSLYIKSKQ